MHPWNTFAGTAAGSLSDDGEFISGQYNANPNCKCNGTGIGAGNVGSR